MLSQITPVLLTYNEEENIGRTLRQLSWAKDIVVVDSGSTDKTLGIIKEFHHVRVFSRPFDTHANQWRFAIEQTKIATDWILRLDADYQVSELLRDELKQLDPNAPINGYRIGFDYAIFSRKLISSLYPANTVLFRRDCVSVWDKGHTEAWSVKEPIGILGSHIIHDDWKSTGRWLINQARYMEREVDRLRSDEKGFLRWLRLRPPLAPIGVLLYCLFGKGLILNGRAGIYYALQRMTAESALALQLLDRELRERGKTEDVGLNRNAINQVSTAGEKPPQLLKAVRNAWIQILGRSSFDRNISFEQAGGNFLAMQQFAFCLEQNLNFRLPLELFDPGLRAGDFVHALEQRPAPSPIDSRPIVFLFPGIYGFDSHLAQFGAGCNDALRIIGVSYPDWREMIQRDLTFDNIVEQVLSHIVEQAPTGSLLFVGHSWGGLVAYAATRALANRGRPVGFLGMLDTYATFDFVPRPFPTFGERARWARIVRDTFFGEWRGMLRRIFPVTLFAKPSTKRLLRSLSSIRKFCLPILASYHFEQLLNYSLRAEITRRWSKTLPEAPLTAPCVVFRAEAYSQDIPNDLGWGRYCTGVEVFQMTGGHLTMFEEPNRTALCRKFIDAVQLADNSTTGMDTLGQTNKR